MKQSTALSEATEKVNVPAGDYYKGHKKFARRVIIIGLQNLNVKLDAARYHARKVENKGTVRQQFNLACKGLRL